MLWKSHSLGIWKDTNNREQRRNLSLLVKLLLEKIELTLSMKSENLKSEKFSLPPMSPRTHKEATDKWNMKYQLLQYYRSTGSHWLQARHWAGWSATVITVGGALSSQCSPPRQQTPVCMLSHFSRVRLCDPIDYSLPDSSVHRIFQARTLEWVAVPSSRGSSPPRS